MKLSHILTLLAVLTVCLLSGTEAGRRNKAKKRNRSRDRAGVCRYKGRAIVGECDPVTNLKTVSYKLKMGRSPATCEPTQTYSVDCDDNSSYTRRNKRKQRRKDRGGKKGCRYERKGSRGTCDPATNTMNVTRTLKQGQSADCPPTKTKARKCRKRDRKNKVCRFEKSEWSECTPEMTHKHRRLTPKEGSPDQCQAFTQTRPCSLLAELTGAKAYKCRYKPGPWSACDPRSDTMTKVWTLKSGDPNVCRRTKNMSRKCQTTCRFRRGEWSACDEETELTTRVDKLVKGNTKNCDATRSITKKCKKACKYDWGEWSECNPDTNQRSRSGSLIKGDAEKCRPENTMYRPCTNRNGEERCFFGPWGDFGGCQNGVMTKHRTVLQGGVECERKAAINRACDDEAS